MKTTVVIAILGALLLSLGAISMAREVSAPSTEFIVAALQEQLQNRGDYLEVTWKRSIVGKPEKYEYQYVWTPTFLYMSRDRKDPQSSAITTVSFDKKAGEYRQLYKTTSNTLYGYIDHKPLPGNLLANQGTVDPIERPYEIGDLLTVISLGKVLPEKKVIDGHMCWGIETESDVYKTGTAKYVVWVDPSIGYSPRVIEIHTKALVPTVVTFSDFIEIGNGAWFPKKMKTASELPRTAEKGPEPFESVYNVESIVTDSAAPVNELKVSFPKGTEVKDVITATEYIQQ